MRDLAEARREFDWLRVGSTVVQQGALRDLDRAFTNFVAGRSGYPTFKKRSGGRQGFVVRDVAVRRINRRWGEILVPKAGWVRLRISRSWTDICAATSARIALRNGRWTMSLTTPPAPRSQASTESVVGIDRGVANSIATSDGRMFHAPGFTWGEQIRSMTRRAKPKPDPDSLGAFLPNGAAAKSSLNRAIFASCWGKFAQRRDHKMSVTAVPAAYTSQECSNCGHTCPETRESQAIFRCQACGFEHHADTNAAINIRDRAFAIEHQPEGISGARVHRSRKRAAPTTSVA